MLRWVLAIVAQMLFVINFEHFELFITIYASTFFFCFWYDEWSKERKAPLCTSVAMWGYLLYDTIYWEHLIPSPLWYENYSVISGICFFYFLVRMVMEAAHYKNTIFFFQELVYTWGTIIGILLYFVDFHEFSVAFLPLLVTTAVALCLCFLRWYDESLEISPKVSIGVASGTLISSVYVQTVAPLVNNCPFFPTYFIPMIFYLYFLWMLIRECWLGRAKLSFALANYIILLFFIIIFLWLPIYVFFHCLVVHGFVCGSFFFFPWIQEGFKKYIPEELKKHVKYISEWFKKFMESVPVPPVPPAPISTKKRPNEKEKHAFHVVDPSPWPFLVSQSLAGVAVSLILKFHAICVCPVIPIYVLPTIFLCYFLYRWFQDIITEAVYQGHHTRRVVQGLKLGMLLFIVSEVVFFLCLFFVYFYYSQSPSIWVGEVWPPKGINPIKPELLPLINTGLLLASGVTLTWAHAEIIAGHRMNVLKGVAWTLVLASLFTIFQYLEYRYSSIHINDSAFGSIFFMVTGFHGFHVLVGTVFILVCFLRVLNPKNVTFTKQHHFGFIAALWYWHFVDVIWLFVFFVFYILSQ
jgi:heme/copper-type cytochrome/quinol oxidase subunit 3